ncbi:MAG: hypothetical protein FIB01_01395 [Gemmatimonadetes bacterium]|nr:hypothetical protein [Gemmatimonadota bacterium]
MPEPPRAEPEVPAVVPAPAAGERKARSGGRRSEGRKPAAAQPSAEPDLKQLGLPTEREAVIAYLREYEGLGPKSVQSLVDAFGPSGVFRALRDHPERVREVVSGARGERLVEAWHKDYQRRVKAQARKQAGSRGARGRRGGRGGKRTTRGS